MRMNRENASNPNNTGYTCSGIMIDSKLRQWINIDLCGKKCLISENKECDYFNYIVAPAIKDV